MSFGSNGLFHVGPTMPIWPLAILFNGFWLPTLFGTFRPHPLSSYFGTLKIFVGPIKPVSQSQLSSSHQPTLLTPFLSYSSIVRAAGIVPFPSGIRAKISKT
jgi:hypothetical protein